MNPCTLCGRKSIAHELCWMHYRRKLRHGDPNKVWVKPALCKVCGKEREPGTSYVMCREHRMDYHKKLVKKHWEKNPERCKEILRRSYKKWYLKHGLKYWREYKRKKRMWSQK